MRLNLLLITKVLVFVGMAVSIPAIWSQLQPRANGASRTVAAVSSRAVLSAEAVGDMESSDADLFQSQQAAMTKFCSSHSQSLSAMNITETYSHLMYDDKYKWIYCFVPKAGCTSLKPVFEYLHGLIEANQTLQRSEIHGTNSRKTLLHNLPPVEIQKRLNTYRKIMFLRDPLERMMSAYKDKLEVPLSSDKLLRTPMKAKVHRFLSQDGQKDVLKEVVSNGDTVPYVSFSDFLMYLAKAKLEKLDQHFMPMYLLCNPCQVNYSFYGSFHNLASDMRHQLDLVGAPGWLYRGRSEHAALSMAEMLRLYFGQVEAGERARLKKEFGKRTGFSFEAAPSKDIPRDHIQTTLDRFKTEFEFYSSLFPYSKREFEGLKF